MDEMDTKKDTSQIRRTKSAILDAMYRLLLEKDFTDITVNDLCEKAEVSRTTFYKYFEDKYKLIEYGMEQFEKVILNDMEKSKEDDSIKMRIRHVYNNKSIFKRIIMGGDKELIQKIHNFYYKYVTEELKNAECKTLRCDTPFEIRAGFITAGILYIVDSWLSDKISKSEDEIVFYIKDMMKLSADLN